MVRDTKQSARHWRTVHGDSSDEERALIDDLVPDFSGPGKIGRPPVHSNRDIINAIMYVTATGCQPRALPAYYPPWNNVHRCHVRWSKDGTWEKLVDRLRELVYLFTGPGGGWGGASTTWAAL